MFRELARTPCVSELGWCWGRSLGRYATTTQRSARTHAQQDQYEVERRATKAIKGGANQAVLMSEQA